MIATCKDFVLIVYNFFFFLSHRFQELGRLQRSSGHTESPSSPGLTCFRYMHCFTYSDCSGPAAGLVLTHPIRL